MAKTSAPTQREHRPEEMLGKLADASGANVPKSDRMEVTARPGDRVVTMRSARGLSMSDLARLIGTTPATAGSGLIGRTAAQSFKERGDAGSCTALHTSPQAKRRRHTTGGTLT
jgi:hypothetical protein